MQDEPKNSPMGDRPAPPAPNSITRRRFLALLGLSGVSFIAAACQRIRPAPSPSPAPRTPTPIPPSPTSPATATHTPTPTPLPKMTAAIGQAGAYDPAALRRELERMLTEIGGLGDLVKSGARVGIKANLTGGTWWDAEGKPPATEMFVTHPAVVGALGELLLDLGARQLTVMDGLGDEENFSKWGYAEMAKPLGAKLLDLCKPDPYSDFKLFPVGSKSYIYKEFLLNGALDEFDAFISVAKMKVHSIAGVTLSMKNLIGLAPISEYRKSEEENDRSALHGTADFDTRLPRVIIDLNRARRIDFALIDGVITAEGGAGPWDAGLRQIRPGLLVASKDPVAADAVAAALMGFDPEAKGGATPFLHSDNHLALAHESNLGTNRLSEIRIAGPAIHTLAHKFKTAG
jgi:uncharacterized protein (DUF362 family)